MLPSILVLLLTLSSVAKGDVTFTDAEFGTFNLFGDASLVGGDLQLTPSALDQCGKAFYPNALEIPSGVWGFSAVFSVTITDPVNEDADGVAFTLGPTVYTVCAGGYHVGSGGYPNSVSVAFRTHQADILEIRLNGDPDNPVASTTLPTGIKTGAETFVFIDYSSETNLLQVRVSLDQNSPGASVLDHIVDVASVLGSSSAFLSLSGATGASGSRQVINSLNVEWRNPCSPSSCQNGGTCIQIDASTSSCACPLGFGGSNCENVVPVASLSIITSTRAGSGTTSEIFATFIGSTGNSGPHSLGSSFTEAGTNNLDLNLNGDIGTLVALSLENSGEDVWRVQTISVSGDVSGEFGINAKVATTRTLEGNLNIAFQTKNEAGAECTAPIYMTLVDENGKSSSFLLGDNFQAGVEGSVDYLYQNLGPLKKMQLGSFSSETWDFDFIIITKREAVYTFTNTLGVPFSRQHHLWQFFPQAN